MAGDGTDSDSDADSEKGIETRSMSKNIIYDEDSERNMLNVVLLSTLGWTPSLWQQTKGTKLPSPKFIFFFFLFIADLADAIFDLLLAFKTMMFGIEEEGAGVSLGILLFVTTILGRLISGLYGLAVSKDPPDEDGAFAAFAMMEMAVFFLEDGASLLVLANSRGGMDIVEMISMWLTTFCGICYVGYFVFFICGALLEEGLGCIKVLFMLIPATSGAFQGYILLTQVILAEEDDPPLSGGLEIAALVVYGVTALVLGGLTTLGFSGCL